MTSTATSLRNAPLSLWLGVIASPAIWFAQFQIAYMLVPWCCRHHSVWLLHLITALTFVIIVACAVFCWVNRRGNDVPRYTPAEEPPPLGPAHFLALLGTLTSILFAVVTVAQGIAAFIINPCWN